MKGIYVLLISLSNNAKIKIGSLGKIKFSKGLYLYVGSAQNNLEKRITRHISKTKKKFWHIDYLLDNDFARIINVFVKKAGKSMECRTALKLGKNGSVIKNFGCSDCRCPSHLIKIKKSQDISKIGFKQFL